MCGFIISPHDKYLDIDFCEPVIAVCSKPYHRSARDVFLVFGAYLPTSIMDILSLKRPRSAFEPPSFTYRFLSSPIRCIAQILYKAILFLRGAPHLENTGLPSIRLICISDTHTHKPNSLPAGDVLVHAGDLTNAGTIAEIQDQIDWLSSLPFKYKVVICGNHDSACALTVVYQRQNSERPLVMFTSACRFL